LAELIEGLVLVPVDHGVDRHQRTPPGWMTPHSRPSPRSQGGIA